MKRFLFVAGLSMIALTTKAQTLTIDNSAGLYGIYVQILANDPIVCGHIQATTFVFYKPGSTTIINLADPAIWPFGVLPPAGSIYSAEVCTEKCGGHSVCLDEPGIGCPVCSVTSTSITNWCGVTEPLNWSGCGTSAYTLTAN